MKIEISTLNAILAAVLGFGVYWWQNRSAARQRLLCELKILRHRVWWELKDDNTFPIWSESLVPLWRAYFEYYRWLFWFARHRVDVAWRHYKGTKKELVELTPDSKCPPISRKEFLAKLDTFIGAIQ